MQEPFQYALADCFILTKEEATEMIIMGFIEPFAKELSMEYVVELNQLIKLEMIGSVG